MTIPRSAPAVGVILSLFAATVLVGCAREETSAPAPEPSVTAEPTPEPTDQAPEEPDDMLFTVSAKVRAIDGTTMDISLVAHSPVPSTSDDASELVDSFVEQCAALGGVSVSDVETPISEESLETFGSTLVKLDHSSTPEGQTFFAPVDLSLGSPYFAEVVSGDNVAMVTSTETCTGRYQLTGSGEGTAITNYESGSATPDRGQWRYGHYGFSVPFESGATIEACRTEVSDLAAESVADIPGWELGADATGISCGIGYTGE